MSIRVSLIKLSILLNKFYKIEGKEREKKGKREKIKENKSKGPVCCLHEIHVTHYKGESFLVCEGYQQGVRMS